MSSTGALQLPRLSKRNMTDLVAHAKRLGIEPGDYAKRLIEDALAFKREAEGSSFAEIMGPVREASGAVDDAEIVRLVAAARTKRRPSPRRKTR